MGGIKKTLFGRGYKELQMRQYLLSELIANKIITMTGRAPITTRNVRTFLFIRIIISLYKSIIPINQIAARVYINTDQ